MHHMRQGEQRLDQFGEPGQRHGGPLQHAVHEPHGRASTAHIGDQLLAPLDGDGMHDQQINREGS